MKKWDKCKRGAGSLLAAEECLLGCGSTSSASGAVSSAFLPPSSLPGSVLPHVQLCFPVVSIWAVGLSCVLHCVHWGQLEGLWGSPGSPHRGCPCSPGTWAPLPSTQKKRTINWWTKRPSLWTVSKKKEKHSSVSANRPSSLSVLLYCSALRLKPPWNQRT